MRAIRGVRLSFKEGKTVAGLEVMRSLARVKYCNKLR